MMWLKQIFILSLFLASWAALAKPPRVLKFEGVPLASAEPIKKKFPFVFEREITLDEADQVMRFLMETGQFASVQIVERHNSGQAELVLQASIIKKIQEIAIEGNDQISSKEIRQTLGIEEGQSFDRKFFVAGAEELQNLYGKKGFFNAKIDIEFANISDSTVRVIINVNEGQPCTITDIRFDTQNPEVLNKAKKVTQRVVGKPLSEDTITDMQKNMTDFFTQNRYLMTRLSSPNIVYNADKTQAKLTYVVEQPYRFEVYFDGNKYFSEGNLIKALELEKMTGVTSSPATDLAERLRRHYQNVGFAHVQVDFREKTIEKFFRQQIRFKIKEGFRVAIRQLNITGNISRPPEYYARLIRSSSTELVSDGYYNRKDFETGYKNLVVELQNEGYLRAKVLSVRTEFSKDKRYVNINVSLDEGPLTQIRQVQFEGANTFSKAKLTEVTELEGNKPLSLKKLESSIEALKEFYRSEGFLEMKLLNEEEGLVSYNETNTQASLMFQIREGPKIVVGNVVVEGNSFTKEYVIRRELEFAVDDVLTPDKIEDTVFRLQKLGLFSQVEIRTLEEGTTLSRRTVVVSISERDPGTFSSGIGLTDENNISYRGNIGLGYRNLWGTGRGISGRVDLKYSNDPDISFLENKISVGYLEPYVFNTENRGRVNIARSQSFLEKERTGTKRTVMLEENQIDFLVERDITRHLKLTYKVWGFSNQLKFYRKSREKIETENIAKIGPMLELDYRDNIFNATKGSYSYVDFYYSDPLFGSSQDSNQTIKFIKSTAGATYYQRLISSSPRFVWANSIRGGYLSNVSNRSPSGVPATEAFFLGGRSTIRGFDSSDIERIPNYLQLGVTELRKFYVTSDSYFYLLKTELRFPLFGSWGGAIFYDGGAVIVSQRYIEDKYRDTIGFGLRYETAVGPVSADFGFKLDRKTYNAATGSPLAESPFAFHFSIGAF